tara:strand:- start:1487 stop:1618 length:132 start_codon:yes stop_codon:yes gene_type:complete
MLNWHKNQVENFMKKFSFSSYQMLWISLFKGIFIGGLIVFFFF